MGHLYIVTHTDLDGAGSAAAALIAYEYKPEESTILFAEPYNLHEAVGSIAGYVEKGDIIVVADLGPSRDSMGETVRFLASATSKGVSVDWYDHHVWPVMEAEKVKGVGVRLTIDTSTCATGVVARYATRYNGKLQSDYLRELESAVCAADLWKWDHPLAPKLFRVSDTRYGEGSDEWRRRLVAKLSQGVLWDEEMEEKLLEYVDRELENFNGILSKAYVVKGSCTVVATVKGHGPPSNSIIGASLLSRYNSDIAVIVRGNGGLSLRSKSVDVHVIAAAFGGGGHPRAAGGKLKIPLSSRILGRLWGRSVSRHAAKLILKTAEEAGVCTGNPRGLEG